MSKQLFNDGWEFIYQSIEGSDQLPPPQNVTLPHDASISQERCPGQIKGSAKGYFPNVNVLYSKKFMADEDMNGKYLCLQFDGVYKNARVLINGNYAASCRNGYERFYVELLPYIQYGTENEIVVEVNAGNDSRWYTGTGIYRNVYLIRSGLVHLAHGGVKIKTIAADETLAVLEAKLCLANENYLPASVETMIEIMDGKGNIVGTDRRQVSLTGHGISENTSRIYIDSPDLWNIDTPNLYTCKISIILEKQILDQETCSIGIRTLSLDPVHGFCINGKTTLLYGGCVHHDNGILGAAALKGAEDRKIRLLKQAGYNAIRFTHNPMSEELMDACDRYGLVVMDELSDIWNCAKSPHDFSETFENDWKRALKSMIDKSYNHPCVVMYSVGNEISELRHFSGKQWGRALINEFRKLDSSRYITSGINGAVTLTPAQMVTGLDPDSNDSSPEEINALMSQAVGQMNQIQCMDVIVEGTREFSEALDIVGYNYAEDKQLLDLDRFTNRICVGSETFPKSLARNWKMILEHPAIIGDFNWTAWDYLGENGIGKNGLYGNNKEGLYEGYPYKTANCGDLDIIGTRRPQSYYRECIIGRRKDPYIAVINPAHYGQTPEMTPWSWPDSVSSWTWDGCEGKPIRIEVYGAGDETELFVNGVSQGRKAFPQVSEGETLAYCAHFDTIYQPGSISCVLYRGGEEIGRYSLKTASAMTKLTIQNQSEGLSKDLKDVLYFGIALTDEAGILKPYSDREITVTVESGGTLLGFGSANPISTENFTSGIYTSYYGKTLLAVKPDETGTIVIKASADGCDTVKLTV